MSSRPLPRSRHSYTVRVRVSKIAGHYAPASIPLLWGHDDEPSCLFNSGTLTGVTNMLTYWYSEAACAWLVALPDGRLIATFAQLVDLERHMEMDELVKVEG